MRRPAKLAAVFLAATLAPARAQEVIGPRIDLRVEQPAYAAMPIWLDVDVHDACLEPQGPGVVPVFVSARGDRAEVKLAGHKAPLSGYPAAPNLGGPVPMREACPDLHPNGFTSQHRFPLHLTFSFKQPGDYSVRWVIPGDVGIAAQSAWLPFTVLASTQTQREAWLESMLSHPPTDPATLTDYIPSLLAAWPDPRVTHILLDFLCAPEKRTGMMANGALTYPIGKDGAAYLVKLVTNRCLTPAIAQFVVRHTEAIGAAREQLLHAVATHLGAGEGQGVTSAISAMQWLRPRLAANNARLGAWADTQVLRVAPSIVAGNDDAAKSALATYLWNPPISARAREVLTALAKQPGNASATALIAIASLADSADLPWLTDRLAEPSSRKEQQIDGEVLPEIAKAFGRNGLLLLRAVMRQSPTWEMRDIAAIELARLGDKDGIHAVIEGLHSTREAEPGYIMSSLQGFRIPHPPSSDSRPRSIWQTRDSIDKEKNEDVDYFEKMLTH